MDHSEIKQKFKKINLMAITFIAWSAMLWFVITGYHGFLIYITFAIMIIDRVFIQVTLILMFKYMKKMQAAFMALDRMAEMMNKGESL